MCRQRENRLVLGEGDSDRVDLRARDFDFFCFAGLGVFDGLFGGFGGAGADGGFVPIVGDVGFGLHVLSLVLRKLVRKLVLNIDFGGRVGVGAAVGFGVDERERHFG